MVRSSCRCNCDDDIRGVAEYGLTERARSPPSEFKFGQCGQGDRGIVEGLDKALKKNGNLILPDPEDPEVQKQDLEARPHFRSQRPANTTVDRGPLRTH